MEKMIERQKKITEINTDFDEIELYLKVKENCYGDLPGSDSIGNKYKDPIDKWCKKYEEFNKTYSDGYETIMKKIAYYNLDREIEYYIFSYNEKFNEIEKNIHNEIVSFYEKLYDLCKKIKNDIINKINIDYLMN